jgi:O-acetyl-ADP-ribose deacetylase (regulator of RNase III)
MLKHTVMSIFRKAEELGIGSVAIPAISSGIYGFPPHECAFIMLTALGEYLQDKPATSLRRIRLININTDTVDYFKVRFDMMREQFEALHQHLTEASAQPA